MERKITRELLKDFEKNMFEDEKSKATVEKYLRDLHCFVNYANDRELDKTLVLEYKAELARTYALTSANSMLAAISRSVNTPSPSVRRSVFPVPNAVHPW